MAVIWTKTTRDARFEVRQAGNSVRLYRNGVFHSQFNPRRPIAANPWSLLLLPAFLRPIGAIKRALILGVGGGAVIRLLHDCLQTVDITGVELDRTHIEIARRFFGIGSRLADLHQADARAWLRDFRGPGFDLIIDDLFGEFDGEPVRAVAPDPAWLAALAQHLRRDGVLVMNFTRRQDLRDASEALQRRYPRRFGAAFRLTLPDYENVVGAFTTEQASNTRFRNLLRAAGAPCGTTLAQLPFSIRRLS